MHEVKDMRVKAHFFTVYFTFLRMSEDTVLWSIYL